MSRQRNIDTRRGKKKYTEEEDTAIVAQTVYNIVISTREDVNPVPLIEILLRSYAHRIRTEHLDTTPAMPTLQPVVPDADSDRPVRTLNVRYLSEEQGQ